MSDSAIGITAIVGMAGWWRLRRLNRQDLALWLAHWLLVWRAGDQARVAGKEAARKMVARLDHEF